MERFFYSVGLFAAVARVAMANFIAILLLAG